MKTFLFPILIALTTQLLAAEIHITTKGNDRSGDGSPERPFATIQRALQNAKAGTTLTLHPGRYRGGIHLSGLNGTAKVPLIIRGLPGQPRPTIQGGGSGLHISKARYLKLEHLEISGCEQNGINCDDGGERDAEDACRYLILKDLHIHDIGKRGNHDGIKLSGVNDYLIQDCIIERTGAGGMSGSGIDQVGCHRGRIRGCTFRDMSANAVQCKGGSEDIEIHGCRIIHGGLRAINIGGSTGFDYYRPPLSRTKPNVEARHIRVIANIFEGGTTPVAFVGCRDAVVAHNTIINPSMWFWRILQEQNGNETYRFSPTGDSRFVNNLIYFERARMKRFDTNVGGVEKTDSFEFAHNLWFAHDAPDRSQPKWLKEEPGSIVGKDPLLADPENGDFRLQAGSPALNQGKMEVLATKDFNQQAFKRPPSTGALESH